MCVGSFGSELSARSITSRALSCSSVWVGSKRTRTVFCCAPCSKKIPLGVSFAAASALSTCESVCSVTLTVALPDEICTAGDSP